MNIYNIYFRIILIVINLTNRLLRAYSEEMDVSDVEDVQLRLKTLKAKISLDSSNQSYSSLYKNLKNTNNTVAAIVRFYEKNNISNNNLKRIIKLNKCLTDLGSKNLSADEAKKNFHEFQKNNKNINFSLTGNDIEKEISIEYSLLRKLISDQNEVINELSRKSLDVEENIKNLVHETKNQSDSILKTIRKSLVEVDRDIKEFRENLSEASAKSLATDYAKAATDERKEANSMRRLAIGAILIIAFISGYTLKETLQDSDLSISYLIVRLSFIFCLSIAAAYFSKESSKHRKQQYFLHERSLSLSTINLYLSDIGKDLKDKAKIDLSTNFFNRNEEMINSNSYPIDLQETLNKLIEKIPSK